MEHKTRFMRTTLGMTSVVAALGLPLASFAAPVAAHYPKSIGKGEGELNIVAWEGYAQDNWIKPFETESGCIVHRKYAGSSDEMVALMRSGGGGQYDLVSASGDAALRLIYGGNVQPLEIKLFPAWKDFLPELQAPDFTTIKGVHYGLSYEWGTNVLMWNADKITTAPDSWSVLYDEAYKGQITVPDNPIHIADAAVYLMATQPDLGIKDPYELTRKQLDATVDLLKKQRPLVRKYWALASDEIELFKNGDATIGAAWQYQTNVLKADKVNVEDTVPKEGATGWVDSWMLSAKSKHVMCAYKFLNYVSSPKVQAQQAIYFGETPANTKACTEMDALEAGSCAKYHLNASKTYFEQIHFCKTPLPTCADGSKTCTSYTDWQRAWQQVKG